MREETAPMDGKRGREGSWKNVIIVEVERGEGGFRERSERESERRLKPRGEKNCVVDGEPGQKSGNKNYVSQTMSKIF